MIVHLVLILQVGIFCGTLYLFVYLPFSDLVPVKNTLFSLLSIILSSFVIQGLLFGMIITFLMGVEVL